MTNLAIRGMDVDLRGQHTDSFLSDLNRDLRADYILANPPFNMSDWGGRLRAVSRDLLRPGGRGGRGAGHDSKGE